MELLARAVGNAVGLWLAVTLMKGMNVPGAPTLLLTIVNLLVVGLVLALVFPLYVLTFGLFALVVNGALLLLTSAITDRLVGVGANAGVALGLHVDSFGTAVLGSILVSIVSALVVGVIDRED